MMEFPVRGFGQAHLQARGAEPWIIMRLQQWVKAAFVGGSPRRLGQTNTISAARRSWPGAIGNHVLDGGIRTIRRAGRPTGRQLRDSSKSAAGWLQSSFRSPTK
jgi:hypothetical protein